VNFVLSRLAFIDWLNDNYWWPVILFSIILLVIVRLVAVKPKAKPEIDDSKIIEEIINNIGGYKNIIAISNEGRRIKFQVKDIGLVDTDLFKSMGATGVFISGNNVKMALPFDVNEIVNKINSNINGGKL
jgi:phosphotransferase system IIB component